MEPTNPAPQQYLADPPTILGAPPFRLSSGERVGDTNPIGYFAPAAGVSASSPESSTSTAEPGTTSKLTASLPVG